MNLLDKFHFKDKNGIQTTMEICDSFSRSKIAEVVGMIPTKVSELLNDSGFITSAALPTKTSQLQNDSGFITSAAVPTKTSQLQNDSGFITSSAIPTNVSVFNNDSGYVTAQSTAEIITSNNFVKIKPRKDDTKCNISGYYSGNFNLSVPYGSGYLADFSIPIPQEVQPDNGWYGLSLNCVVNGAIVTPSISSISKTTIAGYLFSPSSGVSTTIGISLTGTGY